MKLVLIQATVFVAFFFDDADPGAPSEEDAVADREHELDARTREALRPFFPEQFPLN